MATGQELTGTEIGGAAGAVVSFLVAVTGLLRLNTRVVEAEERAAKAEASVKELRDALGAKVSAEVAHAVASLPASSARGVSDEAVRALVRDATERHEREMAKIGDRIDRLVDRVIEIATREP